jgi:hypothetical protein
MFCDIFSKVKSVPMDEPIVAPGTWTATIAENVPHITNTEKKRSGFRNKLCVVYKDDNTSSFTIWLDNWVEGDDLREPWGDFLDWWENKFPETDKNYWEFNSTRHVLVIQRKEIKRVYVKLEPMV